MMQQSLTFEEFLRIGCNMKEYNVKQYLFWVRLFGEYRKIHEMEKEECLKEFIKEKKNYIPQKKKDLVTDAIKTKWYYDETYAFNGNLKKKIKYKKDLETKDNLIEMVKTELRVRKKSYQTEKTYLSWIKRFLDFKNVYEYNNLDQEDVKEFLTYLAIERNVSVSTQNQAFNAILFLYRYIIKKPIEGIAESVRAKYRRKLPIVLEKKEIERIITCLLDPYRLISKLLYGTGMRLSECLNLRIKDLDFKKGYITVRSGKGNKDRITILPTSLQSSIDNHLQLVRSVYVDDRRNNCAGVILPDALEKKYPSAGTEWGWFWLFPARRLSCDLC